ncbi:MAG TPA: retropepsin-like aspartic protease [Bryobacteraceae bacterium]
MPVPRRLAVALAAASLLAGATGEDERAQELFEQHRWFELRDVPVSNPYAAALIKGALAAAFNHPKDAELSLRRAIRLGKTSEQVNAARDKLIALDLRQGRTREAVSQLRARLRKAKTPSPETQSVLDVFGPLAKSGDATVRIPREGSDLPCTVSKAGVVLSIEVNGKKVAWLLDTGFNFSGVSESEARALGITIHDAGASVRDEAGGQAQTKSGVAERMVIGGIEFRNVPFLVFPDAQAPWNDWPVERRGIIGLPVAVAMQTLRWRGDGTCRGGFPVAAGGQSNLAFDDFNLVIRAAVGGRALDLIFDTGNQAGTQVWERLEPGDLRVEAGGFTVALDPARGVSRPPGNDWQHGLLGVDTITAAREVTLDFRNMTATLR